MGNHQSALERVREMQPQILLRQETEGRLRGFVENSPPAIITVAANGHILLANDAARDLLAPGIVAFSEDLRDRGDLSLEHLPKNAKILANVAKYNSTSGP